MTLLDVTVVNVALPNIARDFNTSFANLQWVIATYTLTLRDVHPHGEQAG